jgi:hypothetical protein
MHLEERDSAARLEKFTRIHLRCYLSLGSIPSALSPIEAAFLASNWISEVKILAIQMHSGTIGRHVEVATQANPTTRPTFFSRVSILSSSGWWCTQNGTLRKAPDAADKMTLSFQQGGPEMFADFAYLPYPGDGTTSDSCEIILVSDDIPELMAGKELLFHP